jgi:hypothetical protein
VRLDARALVRRESVDGEDNAHRRIGVYRAARAGSAFECAEREIISA